MAFNLRSHSLRRGRAVVWTVVVLAAAVVIGAGVGVWWASRKAKPVAVTPATDAAELLDAGMLEQDQRKKMWDIEHLAFVLEQKIFPEFKTILASGETAKLEPYLASGFTGGLAPQTAGSFAAGSYTDGLVQTGPLPGKPQKFNNAAEFISQLSDYRKLLDPQSPDHNISVSIGNVRLGPVNRNDLAGPWKGLWRLRIAGKKGASPVELNFDLAVETLSLNDELPEKRHWITSATITNTRLVSASQPLMAETTAASGIDVLGLIDNWRSGGFTPNTGGVYLCDYNQDGALDVLVEDLKAGATLYRGDNTGKFHDVTVAAGLGSLAKEAPSWALSCWADLDGDGDEDLISQNRIFENLGNGSFADVSAKSNLLLTPAVGYALADYDLDGKVDIYVCHTGAYRAGQRERTRVPWIDGGLGIDNVLWRNLGGWQFKDVTAETGVGGEGSSTFSAVWFDANNDRRPDLLAINEFGANKLLMNNASGKFTPARIDPVFGGFSMGVTAGDYDNSGRADIYISNMYSKAGSRILANVDQASYPPALYAKLVEATQGNKLYGCDEQGRFTVVDPSRHVPYVGWGYGASFADFNGDGFLDLYATAGFKSGKRGKPDG